MIIASPFRRLSGFFVTLSILVLVFDLGGCQRASPGERIDASVDGATDRCPAVMPETGDPCPDPDGPVCQWVVETCRCDDDLHYYCSCTRLNEYLCNREYDCYPCPDADAGF